MFGRNGRFRGDTEYCLAVPSDPSTLQVKCPKLYAHVVTQMHPYCFVRSRIDEAALVLIDNSY